MSDPPERSGPPFTRDVKPTDASGIRFLLVGGANTLFATLVFAVSLKVLGPGVPAVASMCIASVASLLTGFFAHRRLVFRAHGHFWLDLARYTGVNYTSLLINIAAIALFADVLGLPPIPVQVGVMVIVAVFGYFGHRHFSFRRKP